MSRRPALVFALSALVVMGFPVVPAQAGGFCHDGGNTQDETAEVDMKGNCFFPTVTTIDVGDKVTWSNYDGENHIILGVGGSWGTPEVAPNGKTAVRFDRPGVYPYWCHIHLGMVGAVVVGDGQPTSAAGGGSGDGPVATLAPVNDETVGATDESETETPAAEDAEPVAAEITEARGIDWGALAAAAALIAITALALLGRERLFRDNLLHPEEIAEKF
jgi:plastocyanin